MKDDSSITSYRGPYQGFQQIGKIGGGRYPVTKQNTSMPKRSMTSMGKGNHNYLCLKEVVHEMAVFIEGTIDMVADYEDARQDFTWFILDSGNRRCRELLGNSPALILRPKRLIQQK